MRADSRISLKMKNILLILLIGFPVIYQSLHQVFSHHHHIECFTQDKECNLQGKDEDCGVVLFTFFPQSHERYERARIVHLSLSANLCFFTPQADLLSEAIPIPPRAPPFS